MKKTFPSKVDVWLVLLVALPLALALPGLVEDFSWAGLVVILFCYALIAVCMIPCNYMIDGNDLRIRCGFRSEHIDIGSISRIAKSSDLSSAPALSMRRLRIDYNKGTYTLVSPKAQAEFVELLCSINPNIECLK